MDNIQLLNIAALLLVALVSVISSAIVAARSGVSITSALDTAFERMENLLEKRTVRDAVEYEYLKSTGAKRNAIDLALNLADALANLTTTEKDAFISRFVEAVRDGKPNTDAVTPVVEPIDDAEPTFIAETLTYNSELAGAVDGTVDTGTDYRYQMRPLNWNVHWKPSPDHKTPPFINAVDGGFKAELAFIAGEVGYETADFLNLEPGTYLVKMVMAASVPNLPETKTDAQMAAALYRKDGTLHTKLPSQAFSDWKGENTYLMPIRIGQGGLFKLAAFVDLVYPTIGAEGSVTFKEIRLETDDGNAGDYVLVA